MNWQDAVNKSNLGLAYRTYADNYGCHKIIRNKHGEGHKTYPNCLIPVRCEELEGYDDWQPLLDIAEEARQKYRTKIEAIEEDRETIYKINQALRMGLVYDPPPIRGVE